MTPELIHRRRWAILAVLGLSVFLVVVDNTIVNVALPTLSRELDASTSQLQWIVDAYSLVFACLLLAFGSLGDRYGRKGALQIGLVLFGLTSVAAAFSGSATGLITARAAMGIGAALVFPATLAILTNVFTDPTERAKAIGAWSAISGLAVALGPLAGGYLLEHFWWGSIFLVNVPIVIAALVLGHRLLPDVARTPTPAGSTRSASCSSITAIALLVYTVIEAPHRGWTDPVTLGSFAVFAVLFVTFVLWERRRHDPMLDVTVFSNPRFSAASFAVAVAFFGLFGFIFLVTQYFQVIRGLLDAVGRPAHAAVRDRRGRHRPDRRTARAALRHDQGRRDGPRLDGDRVRLGLDPRRRHARTGDRSCCRWCSSRRA